MLAIIIVNYKNESRTISYVHEELSKVLTPHIIVVVNNSATDESNQHLMESLEANIIENPEIKPRYKNKRIFILPHSENLGFAKGNNLGAIFSITHFKAEYLLFSNNDLRLISSNVIEELILKLSTLPDIAIIGPKVIGLDGKNQSPEPYYPFWNRYIWMYWLTPFLSAKLKTRLFKLNYSQTAKEGVHYKIMGSFLLVKAEDFLNCGMMDKNTFLFSEEIILTERLKTIGKKTYYYPEVTILHEHSQTIAKHLKNKERFMAQFNSEKYYYKTYKKISPLSLAIGKISAICYLKIKEKL